MSGVDITPDPRISNTLPAWLPDREALSALSYDEARYLDDQWRLAGGDPVDTSWITMVEIGPPFWTFGLALALVLAVATVLALLAA